MMQVIAIKSEGEEWALDVLGIPYGDTDNRDTDGEFFTKRTQLHEDKFPAAPVVYYHGYGENRQPAAKPEYIGRTVGSEKRNDGVWYRVILDKASALAAKVWAAAQKGQAFASSGSVMHLVRKAANGEILEWPVAELSVFDTDNGKRPANRYAVAIPALKAVYAEAGIDLPTLDDNADELTEPEDGVMGAAGAAAQGTASAEAETTATVIKLQTSPKEGKTMSDELNVQQVVADAVAAALKTERETEAQRRQAEAERQAAIDEAVKAAKAEWEKEEAPGRRLPGGGQAPHVMQFDNLSKYDDLEIADLAVLYAVTDAAKAANQNRHGASEDLRRALAVRIADSEEGRDAGFGASKSAMKMAGMPLKANELNQSTLANFGDEWIGVTYSTQLWDKIRLATGVVSKIPTVVVPQGSESVIIPTAGGAPTFYKVAQASAQATNNLGAVVNTINTSKAGTANKTLTVSKLGAAVIYTGELEEDSLIPWASELRRDLTAEAAEVLESIVIDGDTATGATTNINDIAGTPAGDEYYLLLNGFRKLALVTNAANSRDGGTLAIEDYLETVKLMGLGGRNAYDRNMVSCIVDMATYWKTHELSEMKSKDFNRDSTTTGYTMLTPWGYEIMGSPNMHRFNQDATYGLKANGAGKLDLDTVANNTKGAILAVRWDQWRFGYKRRMQFEIERTPRADATSIIVTMRVGMVNRDNEASAISYNITV